MNRLPEFIFAEFIGMIDFVSLYWMEIAACSAPVVFLVATKLWPSLMEIRNDGTPVSPLPARAEGERERLIFVRRMIKENETLRRLYYRMQLLRAKGQSDEAQILAYLTKVAPRTFVEFGFHPIEFNCAALARNRDWQGLLIDGNAEQVADARAIWPSRVQIVELFLSLDNLDFIKTIFPRIGVLSVDVDGNDYWFLEKLIGASPSVICVEYNSSLGLESITVPYDASFDRFKKNPRGWYHGASLPALSKLCALNGYGLAAVSSAGANAFYTTTGTLDPKEAWRPNTFRERFSGVPHAGQWPTIKALPFVTI